MKSIIIWSYIIIHVTPENVIGVRENFPEVKIEQGVLKGKFQRAWKGREFSAFTGIPYAEPPVGELRFEPPIPAKQWKGVFEATRPHAVCTQINILLHSYIPEGEEDCLYLNVYTPLKNDYTRYKLPVMVFIHGGAWTSGDGNQQSYGPDYLLEEDIVLVVINYRLGAFGFLSTEDSVIPGNYGLKDQVLALQWVNKNIKQFGGDPKSVTIFGQSVGAASTILHMFSPISKGLFHRAISQSGSAFASWGVAKPGRMLANAKKLAELVNCSQTLIQEMVKCLKTVKPYDIVNQDKHFYILSYDPMSPYMPVVESTTNGAFLPADLNTLFKSKKLNQVPLMIGHTSEDGAIKSAALYSDPGFVKILDEQFNTLMPIMFHYDETAAEVWKSVKKFYFGNKNINDDTRDELGKLYTDILLSIPIQYTVQNFATDFPQSVYYYLFGFHGNMSFSSAYNGSYYDYGVCHGDDLYYLLSTDYFKNFELSEDEKLMRNFMVALWTNFAKFGDPTPKNSPITPVLWKTANPKDGDYYNIKSVHNVGMDNNLFSNRMEFWKTIVHNKLVKTEF